jgi:hypothetical protein
MEFVALPKHNGTTIEGVYVTRRSSRFLVPVLGRETVPVQARYGVVFANPGTILMGSGAVAVQSWLRAENMSGYCYFINSHWRSIAEQG